MKDQLSQAETKLGEGWQKSAVSERLPGLHTHQDSETIQSLGTRIFLGQI